MGRKTWQKWNHLINKQKRIEPLELWIRQRINRLTCDSGDHAMHTAQTSSRTENRTIQAEGQPIAIIVNQGRWRNYWRWRDKKAFTTHILIIKFKSIIPEKAEKEKKKKKENCTGSQERSIQQFLGDRPRAPPCDLPWKLGEEVGDTFCCGTVFFRVFFFSGFLILASSHSFVLPNRRLSHCRLLAHTCVGEP